MGSEESQGVVFAGEPLCSEEENSAGYGAYAERGHVYAALSGTAHRVSGTIRVDSMTKRLIKPHRDSTVLGQVVVDLPSVMFVKLDKITIGSNVCAPLKDGKLLAPRAAQRPAHRTRFSGGRDARHTEQKPCGLGDIVLATVLDDSGDSYTLGIRDSEMGVVYSACEECGAPLAPHGAGTLYCGTCKREYSKKVSTLYGKADAVFKLICGPRPH